MIYAASVVPGRAETAARTLAAGLEHAGTDWSITVLGKPLSSGQPWLNSRFIPLQNVKPLADEAAYRNADPAEFRQLMREDVPSFDVLFLPSPWGNIPLGMTDPIPAPVVVSIHDLDFEDRDHGMLTDQCRREADKFAKLASAIVFPSEALRERAVGLYGFARERTHVIPYRFEDSDSAEVQAVIGRYIEVFEQVSVSPWKSRPRQRDHVMSSREERVAWLINHTTLRDTEVPIIRSFGLEVYTSKQVPAGNEVRTFSIDFSEDEHSTLPNWVLDTLNRHNFYDDGIPADIAELLNGYFGTIIVSAFPRPLYDLVQHFRGRILVRVFGREAPHNYSEYFSHLGQGDFWKRVWQIQNRFWFAPAYDSIPLVECKLLQQTTVSLPLALPDRILRAANRWQGNDQRILFFCPRIASAPEYYGKIYQEFKTHLGHLPHIVAGHQPIPVNDPVVTGFVSDDQVQAWFREFRVMFYHSREPRHLHYHPLEAAAYGMPLIYMKGGLVDELMGRDKPGACDTYEEAEQKLRRILDGDESLTRSVIESQSPLLDTFRPDYVRNIWEERFLRGVMSTPVVSGVAPFGKWEKTAITKSVPTTPTALQEGRKVVVYLLTRNSDGIHKYVTTLLLGAVKQAVDRGWMFRLIWGTHFTWDRSRVSLPYPKPRGLDVLTLSSRNPIDSFRGWFNVTWWRYSPLYLKSRPLRILVESVLIPLQYIRDVIRQLTLRPKDSSIRVALRYSRIGKRLLQNKLVDWLLPTSDPADGEYASNPPPFVGPAPLPEILSPPYRPYLTLQQIDRLISESDVVLFGNPFLAISPNTAIDSIQRQPIVVIMYDLAHEYTEAWGERTLSVSREMALWGRMSQCVVFGSDYIREQAVKRYGIPRENTRIVSQPPMVVRETRPEDSEIKAVKQRLGLPDRYLLNTGTQATHKNNIAIFQAMRILRWRGFDVPPVVIGGRESRKMLTETPYVTYLKVLQNVIQESGLIIGRDIIILDYIEEADLPSIYAGASLGISVSRSEMSVHGMILECMLYRTPIIASTIPQNVEQLGLEDEYALLVPPDDPVALADAIQHTLENPEATAARVARSTIFMQTKTKVLMANQFLEILEGIAASRVRRAPN